MRYGTLFSGLSFYLRVLNFGASELIGLITDQQSFSSQAPVDT